MYGGTPIFGQRGLWDSCFQNPSERSGSGCFFRSSLIWVCTDHLEAFLAGN